MTLEAKDRLQAIALLAGLIIVLACCLTPIGADIYSAIF